MPGALRVVDGPSAGREIVVDRDFAVGREETGNGNLGNDPELSRRHARFSSLDSGGIMVEDVGSTNGTFVNGTRISEPHQLAPGDTIKIGKTTLQFEDSQATMISERPAAAAAAAGSEVIAPVATPAASAPPPPPARPAPPPAAEPQPVAGAVAAPPPGPPAGSPPPGPPGPAKPERRRPTALIVIGLAVAAGVVIAIVAATGGSSNGSSSTQASAPVTSTPLVPTTGAPAASATPAATTTPAATSTPAPAPASSGSSSTKPTPAGSTLKLGQPAVIAYDDASNHKKSTIQLTPSPIERGSLDDFKNVQLDADQKTSTPFYVKVSVKNIGTGDLSGATPANYIDGVDDRGQSQTSVIFFGDFSRCASVDPKHLKPGESYSTCLTYLIPKGGSIVGMRWVLFDQKTGKSDLNWK
ncbi:MAG TPA: FHA domain-containing protein [Thermoleophilaceae bacterium]